MAEIQINNSIADHYCIFRTKCVPSQRLNMKMYDVWAVVKKDKDNEPGGEILSAYCTCTAGLLGSCNHVAGMLFRVEAAVLSGATHPTCTSKLAEWNVPTNKKKVVPGEITNFLFKQDSYQKKATQASVEERKEIMKKKLNFQVMSDSQVLQLTKSESIRAELYEEVKDIIPKSCFVEFMEAKRKSFNPPKVVAVPNLVELADNFLTGIEDPNIDDFLAYIKLDEIQIKEIYAATTTQSESDIWKKQRIGRITASRFKQIFTRACTLQQKPMESAGNVVAMIMNYLTVPATWQMKHGIASEVHAKLKYKSFAKKHHKNCTFQEPGMTISQQYPFISVTPDLQINCDCHGPGLIEIKCPASLIGQIPSVNNYHHLEEIDGKIVLKHSSEYYFQVQGQMAITGLLYCDFFVFTLKGFLVTRVEFDEEFCNLIFDKLKWFWYKYVGPELLARKLESLFRKFC